MFILIGILGLAFGSERFISSEFAFGLMLFPWADPWRDPEYQPALWSVERFRNALIPPAIALPLIFALDPLLHWVDSPVGTVGLSIGLALVFGVLGDRPWVGLRRPPKAAPIREEP